LGKNSTSVPFLPLKSFTKDSQTFCGFQAMKMGRTRGDTQVVVRTASFSKTGRLEVRKTSTKMKNHVSGSETWGRNKILTMSWGKTPLLLVFYRWEHEKKMQKPSVAVKHDFSFLGRFSVFQAVR
jgi:hypothetical protein